MRKLATNQGPVKFFCHTIRAQHLLVQFRHAVFVHNGEVIQGWLPVVNRHRLLLRGLMNRHVNQLQSRPFVGINFAVLGKLADHAADRLDCVGCALYSCKMAALRIGGGKWGFWHNARKRVLRPEQHPVQIFSDSGRR